MSFGTVEMGVKEEEVLQNSVCDVDNGRQIGAPVPSLQKLEFNASWLVSRLNYIEQLHNSQPSFTELHATNCCHIDEAKSKLQDLQIRIDQTKTILQDLQILHAEKTLLDYIGDDLFSGCTFTLIIFLLPRQLYVCLLHSMIHYIL